MLDLSPTKLLIIFVVVVVILGPKRLPEVARQLGAGWRKVRELHTRLDSEIRQAVPDLPSSQDIVRFARSPVSLLNQLADVHGDPPSPNGDGHAGGAGTSPQGNGTRGAAAPGVGSGHAEQVGTAEPGSGHAEQVGTAEPGAAAARLVAPALARLDTDDPNLN
ncbi:MAG: twin-arginine translocase TatA/TatE family subunit [Actinomycetota bacterium]|nr:twin-arginine translocase TatA/TatE family subunit [Actinomycetota bacterium]